MLLGDLGVELPLQPPTRTEIPRTKRGEGQWAGRRRGEGEGVMRAATRKSQRISTTHTGTRSAARRISNETKVYVDDEDEFAEHRASLGYPPEVVAMAEESCRAVHAAVVAGQPPYDGTAAAWLARVGGGPVPPG